jgi:hypothetical protein
MNLLKKVPRQSNEDWEPVSWTMDHYYVCDDQTIMIRRGDFDPREITAAEVPGQLAHDARWRDYAQHVMKTGEDPLLQFPVELVDVNPVQWILKFEEVCGSLYLVSGRRVRGSSILACELPMYVLRYLGYSNKDPRRHRKTHQVMLRVRPLPETINASVRGNARMLIPNPVALTYEQLRTRRSEAAEAFLSLGCMTVPDRAA